MIESFQTLFQGTYGLITAICLVIGLVLLAIEIFIPGFGVCGITGLVLIVFSIVFRTITSGNLWHLLLLIVLTMLVAGLSVLIAIKSARFGLLSKSPIVQNETAIPTDYASNEKNYGFLMNKVGVTKTTCKPAGKMEYDKIEYQVITNGDYIDAEEKVRVIEVDGSTIVVRKEGKN